MPFSETTLSQHHFASWSLLLLLLLPAVQANGLFVRGRIDLGAERAANAALDVLHVAVLARTSGAALVGARIDRLDGEGVLGVGRLGDGGGVLGGRRGRGASGGRGRAVSSSRSRTALDDNLLAGTIGGAPGSAAGDKLRADGVGVLLDLSPDVELDGLVVGLHAAGDLDGVERGHGVDGGALDLQLRAGVVVLRAGGRALGAVQGDVLDADKVLAVGDCVGDSELDAGLAPSAPGVLQGAVVLRAGAEEGVADLEPVAGAVVGFDVGGGGHVDLGGAC